jgi:hypothetical protein
MQLPQRDKKVRFDVDYTGGTYTESNGKAELVYNRLVQYIVRLMELVMYKKQIDLTRSLCART